MNTPKVHKQTLTQLKSQAGTASAGQASDSYSGSTHVFYAVSVPARREILLGVLKDYKGEASLADWLTLVDALMTGRSHEEKTMGAYLLRYLGSEVKREVAFAQLDAWLSDLVGWAEVDALCQNVFTADELLANWPGWQRFLTKLSKDKNINKRRASLVFLTMPTRKSADDRLHTQAIDTIERLKHEEDILITKAISWLLRSMVGGDHVRVKAYLEATHTTLPKIAVRETVRKIKTGKKNK